MPDLTTLSNGQLTVVLSSLGGELQSVQDAQGHEYLWHGDPEWWSGRAPVLFPIVGRSVDGQVAVDGAMAEMGQHGIARRREFSLAEATQTSARYVLCDDAETRAVYSRAFELSLDYRLEGATLHVDATVRNTGDAPLPFGLGFHPAFAWPLPAAEGKPHHVTLANGAEPPLALLEDGYLGHEAHPSPFKNGVLVLAHDLFARDALVFPDGSGTALTYAAEGGPSLGFVFRDTPNLGIWQKQGAPFLCIEPWHGMAPYTGAGPEIAERPSSRTLAPDQSARSGYSVTIG